MHFFILEQMRKPKKIQEKATKQKRAAGGLKDEELGGTGRESGSGSMYQFLDLEVDGNFQQLNSLVRLPRDAAGMDELHHQVKGNGVCAW